MSVASCPSCSCTPELPAGPLILRLWCPTPHTLGKLRRLLPGPSCVEQEGVRLLSCTVDSRQLAGLGSQIRAALSSVELEETRALALAEGVEPGAGHLGEVRSLHSLLALHEGSWLRELLVDDRLTSWFQPIVDAREPERVVAYEALARCVDRTGTAIPPDSLFGAARAAGLLFQLDLAARRSAIAQAGRHGLSAGLFINFMPSAIYDPRFCLRSTVALLDELGVKPSRIVFEVVESDYVADLDHVRSILTYYRERGFAVALDDVGAGFSSLNLLHELRPDVLKLDMGLVRGVAADPFKATLARSLIESSNKLGIACVAEGVETIEEYLWLRDAGVDLIQGFLFGRPQPAPQPALPLQRAA